MKRSLLCLLLVACTSESESTHIDLVSKSYTLQPGEEKYFCYAMTLPDDRDIMITKITPTYGAATHHILFSQALSPEPDGFSECPVLVRTTWVPLYAGGLDSGPLQLPPNIGFKPLQRGQQIVMQLHLQNATDAPITAKTSLRIDFVEESPEIQPATIFGIDNRKLTIPPHTPTAQNEMSCVIDRDLAVFAVLGHMHKRGVQLDFSRGEHAGAEMLYQEAWMFETQPIAPVSFQIHKGDNLFLRCTHRNDSDAAVTYGESSDTEMCAMVLYYAPSTGLSGCVNN